jgi:hypothetical protein
MTPPSNHPDAGDLARDELLSAYLDGAVTAKQRAEVEALLAEDAGARAVLAQLREVAEAVRHLPTETAPSHIHQDVTARLERETLLAGMDQDVTLARHRRPHWRATLMIAAMVAIAIGGGMYVSLQLAPPAKTGPAVVLDDGSRGGERAPVPDLRDSELLDDLRKLKEASRANGEGAPPATVLPDWAREKSDPQDAGETAAVEPLAAKSAPNDIAASPSRGAPAAAAPTHRVEEANDLIAETTGDMFAELGNTTSTTPASSDRAERARSRQGKSSPARGAGSAIAPMRPVFDSDILARRDLTLEQRLRRGEPQSIAKTHPFAEEPLRLVVRFSDPLVLASHVQHISGMLAERGAPNLDAAAPPRTAIAGAALNPCGPHTRAATVLRGGPPRREFHQRRGHRSLHPRPGAAADADRRRGRIRRGRIDLGRVAAGRVAGLRTGGGPGLGGATGSPAIARCGDPTGLLSDRYFPLAERAGRIAESTRGIGGPRRSHRC